MLRLSSVKFSPKSGKRANALTKVGDPMAKAKGNLSRLDAIGSEMTERQGMGKGLLRSLRLSF